MRLVVFASAGFQTPGAGTTGDLLTSLVRWRSRSRHGHVAIGDGTVVLDPSPMRGDRVFEYVDYATNWEVMTVAVTIDTPRKVNLRLFANPRPGRGVRKSFIRWLGHGRPPGDDCVQTVCQVLRAADLDVPSRMVFPSELVAWVSTLKGAGVADFGPEGARQTERRAD